MSGDKLILQSRQLLENNSLTKYVPTVRSPEF